MEKECRFCKLQIGKIDNNYDEILKECNSFFTIASVGAFINGWSLVVPKKHVYSLRESYTDPEFLSFTDSWINLVHKEFQKDIIVFEHGANHCDSKTSCGTSHGHLHVVPYGNSILERLLIDRDWECVDYSSILSVAGHSEYLLYSDVVESIEASKFYIHILRKEESQYFRKCLADEIGIPDYSYKTSPHYPETLDSFHALKRMIK